MLLRQSLVTRILVLALSFLLSIAPAATAVAASSMGTGSPTSASSHEPRFVSGEVLVEFRSSAAAADFAAASGDADTTDTASIAGDPELRALSTEKVSSLIPNLRLITLEPGVTVEQAVAAYSAQPGVLYAQPNYLYEATPPTPILEPDDPAYTDGTLWGLNNLGLDGATADADIDAPEAWFTTTGTASVVVAVVDTGVDYTHPDLDDNMWVNEAEANGYPGWDDDENGYVDDFYGYDFVNDDGDPMDDHGHGTHTSGTIGAEGNNGIGVVGVNWDVSIMALKFLDAEGLGSTAAAIEAFAYADMMVCDILSNSWTGYGFDRALNSAIAKTDALYVCAAGNSGSNADVWGESPAALPLNNIISVGASNLHDSRAWFSNYGRSSVDLFAPGEDIFSTLPGDTYESWSGTSMATPHVAGVAALLRSVNPSISVAGLKTALLGSTDSKPALQTLCVTGGRLNAANALMLSSGEPLPDDDIPGVPIPATPVVGDFNFETYQGDYVDVYSLALSAGDVLTVRLNGSSWSDLHLELFAPGTPSIYGATPVDDTVADTTYPDVITYNVETGGTYYLGVMSDGNPAQYTVSWRVTADNDIPGVVAGASPLMGSLDYDDDQRDVYAVELTAGTIFSASVTGPTGVAQPLILDTNFNLALFAPWAGSVLSDPPEVEATDTMYPDGMSYRVWEDGTYYLEVYTLMGSGDYEIEFSSRPLDPDDDIPGVPASASPIMGTLDRATDISDVYAMPLTEGNVLSVTLVGGMNTDFDVQLFSPGTETTVWADPIAGAWGASYPSTFYFDPPTTGTYYLQVFSYSGSGIYEIDYNLSLVGTLYGMITGPDTEPLEGVLVEVGDTILSTSTDVNGHYGIEDIPAGTHTVTLSKEGYLTQVHEGIVFTGGASSELVAQMQEAPATITGFVSAGGGPLVGATVTVSNDATTAVQMTDLEGRYRIEDLPHGMYDVSVEAEGFVTQSLADVDLPAGATTPVDFSLVARTTASISAPSFLYSGLSSLTGRLTTEIGYPIANKYVRIDRSLDGGATWATVAYPMTDAQGGWVLAYNPTATAERNHLVRVTYAGAEGTHLASTAQTPIGALVYLSAPRKSVSSPLAGRSFTLTGYIGPRFATGVYPARAYIYKRNTNGTYSLVKSISMRSLYYSTTRTALRGTTSLSARGTYRVRFMYGGTVNSYRGYAFTKTYGPYHYFTVR